MQTESAFLDDLIRHTWEGGLAWKRIPSGKRKLGFSASDAGVAVRAFTSYHNYPVSPGAMISEVKYHVEKKIWLLLHRELEAPQRWKKELWTAIGFQAWEIDPSQRRLLKELGYLIRFDGADPRGQLVLYQEEGCRLTVYVESPGTGDARWTASARSIRKWEDPVDKEIDAEKQAEIISRIVTWSATLNAPVKFGD